MKTATLVVFGLLAACALAFVGDNNVIRDGNTVAIFAGADYASVEKLPLSGPFTLEMNVKIGSQALNNENGGTLFFSQRPGGNTVQLSATGANSLTFSVEWVCGALQCSASVTANVNWAGYQWHTLGAVFRSANEDGTQTEVCLLIDGVLPALCSSAVDASPLSFAAGTQLVTLIGTDGGAGFFVGGIDDVRLWKVGFADTDFDYSTINSADERMQALWRFDEGFIDALSPIAVDDVAAHNAAVNWATGTLGGLYQPCNIPASIAREVEPELRSHLDTRTGFLVACGWGGDPHFWQGEEMWANYFTVGHHGYVVYAGDTDGPFEWAILGNAGECGFGAESCAIVQSAINLVNGQFLTIELSGGSNLKVFTTGATVFHAEGQLNPITGIIKNGECYEAPNRWRLCRTPNGFLGGDGNLRVVGAWAGLCQDNCMITPPPEIFTIPSPVNPVILPQPIPAPRPIIDFFPPPPPPPPPCLVCGGGGGGGGFGLHMEFALQRKRQAAALPGGCIRTITFDCTNGFVINDVCKCPDCPRTPPTNCVFTAGQLGADLCPVSGYQYCGTLTNTLDCPDPHPACTYVNPSFFTYENAQSPCKSSCGTIVSKNDCPAPPPNCAYDMNSRQFFQTSTCVTDCGNLVSQLDCPAMAQAKCNGGWFENPVVINGCVSQCGTLRCPCDAFDYTFCDTPADCEDAPRCELDRNPASPFFRPFAPFCCACPQPWLTGINCTAPPNCVWQQTQVRPDNCVANCGTLVSTLTCQPPTNCHFEGTYYERDCLSNCGTLVSDFGDCTPPQYCEFVNPTVQRDDETPQSCTTDCGQIRSIITCTPPPNCWYEDTIHNKGTIFGKDYDCIGDCGTLRCACPDVGTCVPPSNECVYQNVPLYDSSSVYGRKAPAPGCKQNCGDLVCNPVDPPAACQKCENPRADTLACHGQAYYDCSVALCDDPDLVDPRGSDGACWLDRCIQGTTFAGLSSALITAQECNRDVCDGSCWNLDLCPNFCGGPCAGTCTANGCVCEPGFAGIDCTIEIDTDCFTLKAGDSVSLPYEAVGRYQTGSDWVNGFCDATRSTICNEMEGSPAPAYPGALTMWVLRENSNNTLQQWSVGFFAVSAFPANTKMPNHRFSGTVTIGVEAATSINAAIPILFPRDSASTFAVNAAQSTATSVVYDFTLDWAPGTSAGVVISNLLLSSEPHAQVSIAFAANQPHGLTDLYVLGDSGAPSGDSCSVSSTHLTLAQATTAAGTVSVNLGGAACNNNCGAHQDCESCQADSQCGWCAESMVCLAGDASGPTNGLQHTCQEWRYQSADAQGDIARVITNAVAPTDDFVVRTQLLRVILPADLPLVAYPVLTLPCDMDSTFNYDLHFVADNALGASRARIITMQSQIRSMVQNLRDNLSPIRWNVFGSLSIFSDFPQTPYGVAGSDAAYQRVLGRVQLSDTGMISMEQSLGTIPTWNGGDAANAHFEAMKQELNTISVNAATKTVRMVVLLTSSLPHMEAGYPGATVAEVGQMMLARNVVPVVMVSGPADLVASWQAIVDANWGFGSVVSMGSDNTWANFALAVPAAVLAQRNSFQIVRGSDDAGVLFSSTLRVGQIQNLLPGTTVAVPITLERSSKKRDIDAILNDRFTLYVPGYGSFFVRAGISDRPAPVNGGKMDVAFSMLRDEKSIPRNTIRLTRTSDEYTGGNEITTVIDSLPAHGKLYQYKSDSELGAEITSVPAIVEDVVNLRVVYRSDFLFNEPPQDGFDYHGEDGCGYPSPSGHVDITVVYFNYPPVCEPCYSFILEDSTANPVFLNDSNVDTAFNDQAFFVWTNMTPSWVQSFSAQPVTAPNVFAVTPVPLTFGNGFTFTYSVTDPLDRAPAASGPCQCVVDIDHVNHCPRRTDQTVKTGNDNDVIIDLTHGEVDAGDPQMIYVASLPTTGTLHICQPNNNTVGGGNAETDFLSFCNVGAQITTLPHLIYDSKQAQYAEKAGRVVFRPLANAGTASQVSFQVYATDDDIGAATPAIAYKQWCSSADSGPLNRGDGAVGNSVVTVSIDSASWPEAPVPVTRRANAWEDTPLTITITTKEADKTTYDVYILSSLPAEQGSCTQMDGTAIPAGVLAAPLLVTDSDDRIICTPAANMIGDVSATPAYLFSRSIAYRTVQTTGGAWQFNQQLPLTVYPVNDVPALSTNPTLGVYETPNAQFQPQAIVPVVIQLSDIDVQPSVQDIYVVVDTLPTLGQLLDTDGVTPLTAGSRRRADRSTGTVQSIGSLTLFWKGLPYKFGSDSFEIHAEDGAGCGGVTLPTGFSSSPCQASGCVDLTATPTTGNGCSASQIVSVEVTHVNHPPFATLDKPVVCQNTETIVCVGGYDNDVADVLASATVSQLPLFGQIYALQTSSPASRTLITPAMMPFTFDSTSIVGSPAAGVVGCVAYVPFQDAWGRGVDSVAFTVNDGQLDSPATSMSLDVFPVYSPPEVNPQTITLAGDTPGSIRLGTSDSFVTPDRTYRTEITRFPAKGTLLNNDLSAIVADPADGKFYLRDAYEVVFVPDFNTQGTNYASFDFEVVDVALANLNEAEFRVIDVGSDMTLGTCTDYRPSTGTVTVSINVNAVNHAPQLVTPLPLTVFQNELLTVDLEFTDIDGDSVLVYITGLPSNGYLYTEMPEQPAEGADVCGALPNYAASTPITSVEGLAPIEPNADGHFVFYYYPDANGFGTNFDQIVVRAFDRPADQAADLLLLPPYVPTTVGINVLQTNQAPQIFYQDELLSGSATTLEDPLQEKTGRNSDGKLTKKLQMSITDVDAGNQAVRATIATDNGVFVNLKAALGSASQLTVNSMELASNGKDGISANFTGRIAAINNVLAELVLSSGGAAVVTITCDDLGNSGSSNPKCPSGLSTGYWRLSAASQTNVGAAVGGAAAAGVIASTAVGAAAAGLAWVVGRRTNLLDEAAVPFDDDQFSNTVTDSPAFQPGTFGGANPISASKAAVDGGML